MTKKAKFKLSPLKIVSITLVSSLMAWFVFSVSAATGVISLQPNSTSFNKGDTISLTVKETTDVPLITVAIKVKFDPQKVKYKSVDFSGTPFPGDMIAPVVGNDYIAVTRFKFDDPKPSGENFIAKIEFEALASSGTTQFTVVKDDDTFLGSAVDASSVGYNTENAQISFKSPTVPVVPTTPTSPPVSNPAGPTHTVSPTPSTPTPSAPAATSTPRSTSTPAPSSPPTNPISNYFQPATNPSAVKLKPGDSKLSKPPSLIQKILIWVKLLAPIIVVGGIIAGIVWFIVKKISLHAFGFGEAVTGLPHVGPVKAPLSTTVSTPSSAQDSHPIGPIKPSPNSGSAVKPSPVTDPNDHTPRTFSGV